MLRFVLWFMILIGISGCKCEQFDVCRLEGTRLVWNAIDEPEWSEVDYKLIEEKITIYPDGRCIWQYSYHCEGKKYCNANSLSDSMIEALKVDVCKYWGSFNLDWFFGKTVYRFHGSRKNPIMKYDFAASSTFYPPAITELFAHLRKLADKELNTPH